MAADEGLSDTTKSIQSYIEDLQDLNPRLRSNAAQELGKLKVKDAVVPLTQQLRGDVNTYVRCACAEALSHIGSAEVVFPLIDALNDSCSFVRRAAAIALGQMQAKEAQAALLRTLNDPNFYVRRASINAIGKLGIADMGLVLLPLLDATDLRIRRTVITALRRLQTREAVPHMVKMLEMYLETPNQRNLPVVKTLVIALGDLRAKEAISVLIDVVRGFVGVRSLAVNALGQIGDPRAGPALMQALTDRSINLRLASLKSLGRLEYNDAIPSVRNLLTSSDPRLRRAVVLTLGQLKDKKSIPLLLSIAREDTSPLVRPAAVEALGAIGDSSLVHELLPLVTDANAYLRADLAYALSALNDGSEDVLAALQMLSEDQVEHVAIAAQRVLRSFKKKAENTPKAKPGKDKVETSWLKRLLQRSKPKQSKK